MIGVSFYLNDPLAEQRLAAAGALGVRRAFTSLHIPEESGDLAGRARHLLQLARELWIDVYADVSYRTPAHLGIDGFGDLAALGVAGLRLDDFFERSDIIGLARQFKIALNASILLERELDELLAAGLPAGQLIAWHNFYPRRETGLDEGFFRSQNELFHRRGIPVSAYVPGGGAKRGPLFEGLPTLEKHREGEPFPAALELLAAGADDVYIGDPDPGPGLLERLVQWHQLGIARLRVESAVWPPGEYPLRPDWARDVLRLMNTRTSGSVPPQNTVARPRGTLTMDNDNYGRYRGEVQITLRDLAADRRVNVIGRIIEADLPLLARIRPGQRLLLEKTEE
ncbi:hypothetical protein EDC14_102120 [Hydrogenispora ethanolica]|uniref:DUF871 domain-containing protein n=1 Tax=Hydrogenispora ethanolica TaxID=1082276 RepID=A0A4R1RCU2_HYDET|nr:MupG family TIM beta-alpha barrel fold protein [Hydrogenispora ethanolica]TCL63302.1 hypothetical protein EDC14_102120 [Hydrogenispora ethanolica]